MKKAFTLLELVFVVVIIGILSTFISPTFGSDPLNQAANQIVSHIRYTQHLAMMDNKFNPTDPGWFHNRWQIYFAVKDKKLGYTIYQDLDASGSPSTVVSKNEVARNPINPKQLLTSRSGNRAVNSEEMMLSEKYDIKSVSFSRSCTFSRSKMISFDHLGRPLFGKPKSLLTKYRDNNGITGIRLIATQCRITLTDNDGKTKIIAIEPETGYTHIL